MGGRMYRSEEREEAIKSIQRKLIAIYDGTSLFPSGIYDSETKNTVMEFQRRSNLAVDGRVNLETFRLLSKTASEKERIKEVRKRNEALSFPIKFGDYYPDISGVNNSLSRLLEHYGVTHSINGGAFFGKASQSATEELRKIYRLPQSVEIDEELYERMRLDLESMKIK